MPFFKGSNRIDIEILRQGLDFSYSTTLPTVCLFGRWHSCVYFSTLYYEMQHNFHKFIADFHKISIFHRICAAVDVTLCLTILYDEFLPIL